LFGKHEAPELGFALELELDSFGNDGFLILGQLGVSQRGYNSLARLAFFIAVGLDKLKKGRAPDGLVLS
jgi:hypothetical protein